jgi:hypothetical protein
MFYLQSAPVAVVALLATVATAACKEHGSSAVSRTTGGLLKYYEREAA